MTGFETLSVSVALSHFFLTKIDTKWCVNMSYMEVLVMPKQGINPFRGAPIPKSRIESAISRSLSMKAAARELNVSYNTFKKYAKMYGLFEANVGGKGVYRDTGNFGAKIEDLMKGAHPNYPHWKLQEKLFQGGFLEECCSNCGYEQKRDNDLTGPYLLDFLDGNDRNNKIDNLRVLCYNCYYILKGGGKPINSPRRLSHLREVLTKNFEESA